MDTRKIFSKFWLPAFSLVVIFVNSCNNAGSPVVNRPEIEIRGIYGGPNAFWKKGIKMDSLNVNAVFMGYKSINEKILERARQEGLKVYAEFAALNGKGYVEDHPEAWAIDSSGKKVEAASWFMGVCPTEPGFRQYRMKELRELLKSYDIDGVWLDYLHWHAQFEEPEPILPETCFCESCLTAFQSATGINVEGRNTAGKAKWILENYEKTWREWRCSIVAGWARDARMIIKSERPGALLGIYHCPWADDEFNGARYRILGLDYDMLKNTVDVFSPMVYHGRMGRSAEWVGENIVWFCNRLGISPGTFPKAWPIVQASDEPGPISSAEFEKVLRGGAGACATGVMMFTTNSVADSPEKTEIMKKVYGEWKDRK